MYFLRFPVCPQHVPHTCHRSPTPHSYIFLLCAPHIPVEYGDWLSLHTTPNHIIGAVHLQFRDFSNVIDILHHRNTQESCGHFGKEASDHGRVCQVSYQTNKTLKR